MSILFQKKGTHHSTYGKIQKGEGAPTESSSTNIPIIVHPLRTNHIHL